MDELINAMQTVEICDNADDCQSPTYVMPEDVDAINSGKLSGDMFQYCEEQANYEESNDTDYDGADCEKSQCEDATNDQMEE